MHLPSPGPILPPWVADALGTTLGVVALLAILAAALLGFFLVTLLYGWIPARFLKRKRHLLWLFPLLNGSGVVALGLIVAGSGEEPSRAGSARRAGGAEGWADGMVLLGCLGGSALAALVLLAIGRIAFRVRASRRGRHGPGIEPGAGPERPPGAVHQG